MKPIRLFDKSEERLAQGIEGFYPDHLIEVTKEKAAVHHQVNEAVTRPWLKHFFLMQSLRDGGQADDATARDDNLLEIFKTTVPLAENSFQESSLSSWRMFLETIYRDSDTPWYAGIRKILIFDRFHSAIEQLELELPESNTQRAFHFPDHHRAQRKIPRVPVKLFFALPGNEKERFVRVIEQVINNNPHNIDVGLLAYAFFRAWGRSSDFLRLVQQEHRRDLEEWYHWVEGNLKIVGAMKAGCGDHATTFYIYDRASLTPPEYKEVADWFLRENEFKASYHFYYKAKEFETALDLLQNISTKEFAELMNMRRISRGERPHDLSGDLARFAAHYGEEMETLRGFARIRAAETYKHVAVKARQHFDRETIETKYAFGELTEDEYQRLIRQLQERKQ